MTEHTHLTRAIMAPGKCPACDEYYGRQEEKEGRDALDLESVKGVAVGKFVKTSGRIIR